MLLLPCRRHSVLSETDTSVHSKETLGWRCDFQIFQLYLASTMSSPGQFLLHACGLFWNSLQVSRAGSTLFRICWKAHTVSLHASNQEGLYWLCARVYFSPFILPFPFCHKSLVSWLHIWPLIVPAEVQNVSASHACLQGPKKKRISSTFWWVLMQKHFKQSIMLVSLVNFQSLQDIWHSKTTNQRSWTTCQSSPLSILLLSLR